MSRRVSKRKRRTTAAVRGLYMFFAVFFLRHFFPEDTTRCDLTHKCIFQTLFTCTYIYAFIHSWCVFFFTSYFVLRVFGVSHPSLIPAPPSRSPSLSQKISYTCNARMVPVNRVASATSTIAEGKLGRSFARWQEVHGSSRVRTITRLRAEAHARRQILGKFWRAWVDARDLQVCLCVCVRVTIVQRVAGFFALLSTVPSTSCLFV